VKIAQKTAYPNDGEIAITIDPDKTSKFALHLRIPTWAQGKQFVPGELYRYIDTAKPEVSLTLNGEKLTDYKQEKGFMVIEREWNKGDRLELSLPMPIRVSECHKAVAENTGRIALTRGPLVMCAEGVDNAGASQRFFFPSIPDTSGATTSTKTIDSGSFLQTTITASTLEADGKSKNDVSLVLTPYYAWNNRGNNSMTVWFPTKAELAVHDPLALPKESAFAEITASHTSDLDTTSAIGDGQEPRYSSGNNVARWTSRGQEGKKQWVEGHFAETKMVQSVGVYWMDDHSSTVKFPKEWSLEVKQDDKWVEFELYTTDKYDTRANQYNVVHPAAPLKCDAIRIHITPRDDQAVGILECQVQFE
jgi:uncharacterized protein